MFKIIFNIFRLLSSIRDNNILKDCLSVNMKLTSIPTYVGKFFWLRMFNHTLLKEWNFFEKYFCRNFNFLIFWTTYIFMCCLLYILTRISSLTFLLSFPWAVNTTAEERLQNLVSQHSCRNFPTSREVTGKNLLREHDSQDIKFMSFLVSPLFSFCKHVKTLKHSIEISSKSQTLLFPWFIFIDFS